MSQTKELLSRTSKEERGLKDEGKRGEEKPQCTSANLHVGQDPGPWLDFKPCDVLFGLYLNHFSNQSFIVGRTFEVYVHSHGLPVRFYTNFTCMLCLHSSKIGQDANDDKYF